jgi:Tfp pilus assembly protein PilF
MVGEVRGSNSSSNAMPAHTHTAVAPGVKKIADEAKTVVKETLTKQTQNEHGYQSTRIVPVVYFKIATDVMTKDSQKIATKIFAQLAEIHNNYGLNVPGAKNNRY